MSEFPGTLDWQPALDHPELLADPVTVFLRSWPAASSVAVAPIDPSLADTAEFCAAYAVDLAVSANCVVVAGRRGGETRYAACLVLATTRADVNGVVRRLIDARKASFAAMDDAVGLTQMAYGGITAIGLPADWPIFVAGQVAVAGPVVIGSGRRDSKLALDGALLADLPNAQVVDDLAS